MGLSSEKFVERLSHRRHLSLLIFDSAAWIFAMVFATLARLDFQAFQVPWAAAVIFGACTAALFGLVAWVTRLHDGRAPLGSLDEAIRLAAAALCVGIFMYFWNLLIHTVLPRSVPLIATLCAIVLIAWSRALARSIREHSMRTGRTEPGQPVLVVGAGDGGLQLVRSMRSDPTSRWNPVGVLDDDRRKRHLLVGGVPVVGTIDQLVEQADALDVGTIVVAIPSAPATLLRHITEMAGERKLSVKVVPGVNQLMHGRAGISDVRDIDIPDLLGRRQIDTDISAIAGYLTGQRVLVTGAGGSIGSELCRQIHRWGPERLIMLDRDESALHAVQLSIEGRAMLDSPDIVLADIRDSERIREIFADTRPQVVFHAAALKHMPMLEQYPAEAVKTNIWGTQNVLEAAQASGVERFVNISTDKAANPANVLGYSKRIAEGLTATMAAQASGTYLSVRFGNVLGSRGSVLTAFAAQIAAGGPVTVTHPEVTRFFMTVDEAVQLVIQAAILGRDGEALVLDMGEPVSIDAVAKQLIAVSKKDIDIVYTGLREHEKMHEELLGDGEPDIRPSHPLVSHVDVPRIEFALVRRLPYRGADADTLAAIKALCDIISHGTKGASSDAELLPR